MEDLSKFQQRFEDLNCCVLIPTYNNEGSLRAVILELLKYTDHILIVNDGSTDSTRNILREFENLQLLHFDRNRGKGAALKAGFKKAQELGYKYAITIDSDGQHYADDLEIFLKHLELKKAGNPEILLVGDRNMLQEGIPAKSSLGNKFSSFWYMVLTGTALSDTQSGYRLYPLDLVNSLQLHSRKFEFEIEIMVKAAWKKVQVKNIPIKVFYEKENRVTHFRPFRDIFRITLLYIYFIFVSFFYVHPASRYRDFKQKGLKNFWKENVLRSREPAHKKAAAVALGVFIGLTPFWGFHTLLIFIFAAALGLNKVTAFLFSNISILPLIPVVIYISYQTGSLVTGNGFQWELNINDFDSQREMLKVLMLYLTGSFALAGFTAFLLWVLSYFFILFSQQRQMIKS